MDCILCSTDARRYYQYIDIVLQYPQFHGIDFPTKETSFLITSMINLIE